MKISTTWHIDWDNNYPLHFCVPNRCRVFVLDDQFHYLAFQMIKTVVNQTKLFKKDLNERDF